MKSEFKSRPQSKRNISTGRPVSRYINTQQAKVTFQQAKQEQSKQFYQKAIEYYIRATIYDPNYYQAYCNMGSCYRALKQYSESRRYYMKAISIKRDDAISHYNLANVLRLLGDLQASIEHYLFVIGLKEGPNLDIGNLYINSLINLGICYKNKELFDKATDCYQRALSINPKDQSALFNYGMTIASNLARIDSDTFRWMAKEKAEKAVQIFKRYSQIVKTSQMVEFQLLRMTVFLDNSAQNIGAVMQKLKQMLKASDCTIKDEINFEMGHCLKLLKKYEDSAQQYRKSFTGFYHPGEQNKYDQKEEKQDKKKIKIRVAPKISEEEGVKMIEEGMFQEAEEKISQLNETDMSTHVLKLALELSRAQDSPEHLKKANLIYMASFQKDGKELDMDLISIEGHKMIGYLLSLNGKFKQSIKHFQYVSVHSEKDKARAHENIANDYSALGNNSKALQQYKIALNGDPGNYEMNYNVGCILFEDGAFPEAMGHFQRFLQLLQENVDINLQTKKMYIADCLMTMASCKLQLQLNKANAFDSFMKAWTAIRQVFEESSVEFKLHSKIFSFYEQWADLLEQRLSEIVNRKSEQYVRLKSTLFEVYTCLLQNQDCPDRDAIMDNCATIYYEEKLYVNALASYSQIENKQGVSANNLALTYLHLHEHYMASEYIFKAIEDSMDDTDRFNKEIICWIFGLEEEENKVLGSRFSNRSEEGMLIRLEYGKMLVDAITSKLMDLPSGKQFSQIKKVFEEVISSDSLAKFVDQAEVPKVNALESALRVTKGAIKYEVDPNVLAGCLKPSANVEQDFTKLLKGLLQSGASISQPAAQILISLFVFRNRSHIPTLRAVLHKWSQFPSESLNLALDRRATVPPDLLNRIFGDEYKVNGVQSLVAHLMNWQSELQSKYTSILKTVERYYYKSNFRKPLLYDFSFPRHSDWSECNTTFLKIALVIHDMLKIPSLTVIGGSLAEMKNNIYVQLEQQLVKKVRAKETFKLSFSDQLMPITLVGCFQSKKDCLQFLRDLQKESSSKHNIDISKDCRQVVVTLSGLVHLVCQWQQPNPILNMLRGLSQHPLSIECQSVITLASDLYLLRGSSEVCAKMLQQISILRQ